MMIHQPRNDACRTHGSASTSSPCSSGAVDGHRAGRARWRGRPRDQPTHDVGDDAVPTTRPAAGGTHPTAMPSWRSRAVRAAGAATCRFIAAVTLPRASHEQTRQWRFHQAARGKHGAGLLDAGFGDERPAIRMQRHDVSEREMMQRLAHPRPTHAEQIRQRFFAELGTWRQAVFFDRANDMLIDALRGFGFAGRLCLPSAVCTSRTAGTTSTDRGGCAKHGVRRKVRLQIGQTSSL